MSILFTGARVLDPSRRDSTTKEILEDVLVGEDGKIAAVGKPGSIPSEKAKRIVPAKGSWLLPGMIDAHTHLREPGLEHKETIETGTLAAVAGGFTSVACMANTQPVNDNPYITAYIRERARVSGHCRVIPVGAVSKGLKGEELAEIGGMIAEGARAISDDGMPVMNSYLMRRAMEYARAFNVPVISHAEDLHLSSLGCMNEGRMSEKLGLRGNPSASEEILVAREIALCRLTGARVHIAHVSSRLALAHLRRAKEDGLPVTAEVTPHHLSMTEDDVEGYDTCCKMAPPLREKEDVEALRVALASGLIDLIATDHAPHARIEKDLEFEAAANGILGLQTAMAVTLSMVHSGALPLARWLDAVTAAPAKLLGLDPPRIAVGAVADLCLMDPMGKWTFAEEKILSRSRNSPWVGKTLQGRAKMTLVGGKVAYEGE